MNNQKTVPNRLINETSPYLLQHAENPVDWYPWGEEAFERAQRENKPVFLSIGYSTCHWCHVMARESFQDPEIAGLLNRWFIAVKVDREERPDIDSIYMAVCQAFTGSGGWPATIFLTPEKKPFFAGTYFPPTSRYGRPGLADLLAAIHEKWQDDPSGLTNMGEDVAARLSQGQDRPQPGQAGEELLDKAAAHYERAFDDEYGGFGPAPKFPAAHNLLFLLDRYEKKGDKTCLDMTEKTLVQMFRGGIFDHIGGGFCRYSTDRRFLVPHFEKMLYDNALLIMAYAQAFQLTGRTLYAAAARRVVAWISREMTSPEGGFFSGQDADSDHEEGKFYLLQPQEVVAALGQEQGEAFNSRYDVTKRGNFQGKNIPNLLLTPDYDAGEEEDLSALIQLRRERASLAVDDKCLTAWNSLLIAALCRLYRATGDLCYLDQAKKAQAFIRDRLWQEDRLCHSYRGGKRGGPGFVDDYAYSAWALLELHQATLDQDYLDQCLDVVGKAQELFADPAGGFFFTGTDQEQVLFRPKETYDGAMPSANSVLAYVLVRLSQLLEDQDLEGAAQDQVDFMAKEAGSYPLGYALFLLALSHYTEPPEKIVAIPAPGADLSGLPLAVSPSVGLNRGEEDRYPLKEGRTTYYVCQGRACLPPVNDLAELER